jgi:hypothetical protein
LGATRQGNEKINYFSLLHLSAIPTMNQEICKNCSASFTGRFCPNCGQKVMATPLSFTTITAYIQSLFEFDSGFFFTCRVLFSKPEKLINDFLGGKSKPYKNPVQFILTIIALVYFLEVIFRWHEAQAAGKAFNLMDVTDQLELTFNTFNLVLMLFTIVFNYLLLNSRFTFTEHIVIALYQLALVYMLGTAFVQLFYYGVFEGPGGQLAMVPLFFIALPLLVIRFYVRVFSGKKFSLIIKSVVYLASLLAVAFMLLKS